MPHFIIHTTENVLIRKSPKSIMEAVHETANASGLFDEQNIKVRIAPFEHALVAGKEGDFIHVFAYIMQGRTEAQKAELSSAIVACINAMVPDIPVISMNVMDFEKSTYFNKNML